MPEAKEVQEKLHELNLATLASERKSRQEWFREQKIDLIEIETTFYLAPKDVSRAELSQHMIYLNQGLRSVRAELAWMKERNLIVKMEKNEFGERYVYVGERKEEKKDNQGILENSGRQNTQSAKEKLEKKNNPGVEENSVNINNQSS